MRKRVVELNKGLRAIADSVNKELPRAAVQFMVGAHFVERLIERHGANYDAAMNDVLCCIEANICVVIYYIHLDTILPDRGKLEFRDFQVRGNVVNGKYTLSTFVRNEK